MLSVSGLRGLIGQSLTPVVAARYGQAVGQWFKSQTTQPHIVVGRDSRPSGPMVEMAMIAGLTAVGCRVTRLGIASTPGVALMAGHLKAQGGVVITASHNPIQWNGIKVLRHDGTAPTAEQANQIIQAFHADEVSFVEPAQMQPIEMDESVVQVHLDAVLPHVNAEIIRQKKLKVVLDSVHGAGGAETIALLDALGVELVHLWGEPTGLFPHTPEPLEENLRDLAQAVVEHQADIGFAQDPDADRLAVVDNTGKYIGEEYTLALSALHVLQQTQGSEGQSIAVTNLSSSRMLDDIALDHGGKVLRSKVGEANVAQMMQENRAIIGGEGNGGVIWPKVCYVRDSLVGIALLLEMRAMRDEPLDVTVASVASYAIVKEKVGIEPGMTDRIEPALRSAFPDAQFDTQDGVRVDWVDRWVHVRSSNTEPILRLIAEAPDKKAATALTQQAAEAMGLSG